MISRFWFVFVLIPISFTEQKLLCRNTILEFKGAYFLPTNCMFKNLYKGDALYGPEFTIQLCKDKNWYAFASIDYYKQQGRYLSLADSTTVKLLSLGAGIKYFFPINKHIDFYTGLGFRPVYVRTKSCRACVVFEDSQWGYGGIAKLGTYIHLPKNFLLDLFVDYSFVWTKNLYGHTVTCSKSNISGLIFGVGLGYNF